VGAVVAAGASVGAAVAAGASVGAVVAVAAGEQAASIMLATSMTANNENNLLDIFFLLESG
jgi:hypothetical protein